MGSIRKRAVRRIKRRLLVPRFQMAVMVGLAGLAGFVTSYGLLQLGVLSMGLRYPLAVVAAYAAFLVLLWLWLRVDSLDGPDPYDLAEFLQRRGEEPENLALDGGDFGGGGVSGEFEADALVQADPALDPDLVDPASSGGGGFEIGFEFEELILVIVIAAAVLSGFLGTAWIVWTAPTFLAELVVDAAIGSVVYRHLRRPGDGQWFATAVGRTFWIAFAMLITFGIAGAAMQSFDPTIVSIGDVFVDRSGPSS